MKTKSLEMIFKKRIGVEMIFRIMTLKPYAPLTGISHPSMENRSTLSYCLSSHLLSHGFVGQNPAQHSWDLCSRLMELKSRYQTVSYPQALRKFCF